MSSLSTNMVKTIGFTASISRLLPDPSIMFSAFIDIMNFSSSFARQWFAFMKNRCFGYNGLPRHYLRLYSLYNRNGLIRRHNPGPTSNSSGMNKTGWLRNLAWCWDWCTITLCISRWWSRFSRSRGYWYGLDGSGYGFVGSTCKITLVLWS